MRILKIFILLIGFNLMAQEGNLNKSNAENFKAKVIERANGIQSLSADFTQQKHMEMMESNPESKGRVFYKSPNLLKWEYLSPYHYQILFKNDKLFIHEEDQINEVDLSSNKTFGKMGELVASSLNGKILEAEEDFDISFINGKDGYTAIIIPKHKELARIFKEIRLNFTEDKLIRTVRLFDPSGDETHIFMKNIKINQPINPSVFQN